MTKRWIGIGGFAFAAVGVAFGLAVASTSCQQTPTNVPVRTFEQAQKVDVVCLHVLEPDGGSILPPQVTVQENCAPVPANVIGGTLPFHLFAVVTQTTRGELAVVDLTGGTVVDEDKSTPGTNFIPVGTEPTDVVVAPDSKMTFVASGSPTKPAIFGIRNDHLLGDYAGVGSPAPLRFTDLQACLLPQPPQALAVSSRPGGGYVILATLRPWAGLPAQVVAVDPAQLTPSDIAADDAGAEAGATDAGVAQAYPPGTLLPCSVIGRTGLSQALPASWSPGPFWPDGVPYVDGGVVAPPQETLGPTCAPAVLADGGTHAPGVAPTAAGDAPLPFPVGTLDPPLPTAIVVRDDAHILYVADDSTPVIHVIDVSNPASPQEQAPLLAASTLDPSRRVTVGAIAMSPVTRDFKRYLYAVDKHTTSLMVFDVTDPAASPHAPLRRPHSELSPMAEPDRIAFPAPIASVTFVQHDWPVPQQAVTSAVPYPIHQYTGLLCNPNPNAHPDAGITDLGAYYRVDEAALIQQGGVSESFPFRLRGVFGFVTLSNGNVYVIDVDDWDAPCRRPDPMAAAAVTDLAGFHDAGVGQLGVLDVPEPAPGPDVDSGLFDPYHAPISYSAALPGTRGVTLEPFFPVSAPHRPRSGFLLLNDPVSGVHIPYLPGTPGLFASTGAPLPTSGSDGVSKPLLLPTALPPGWIDDSYLLNATEPNPAMRAFSAPDLAVGAALASPSLVQGTGATTLPSVRVSFDDPTAHQDQDWAVTYEGTLPTVGGIAAQIVKDPDAGYRLLRLNASGAAFCERGIEDSAIGQWRAQRLLDELSKAGLPAPPCSIPGASCADPAKWTSDYVQITDDVLPQTDGYWGLPNDCWDDALADDPANGPVTNPSSHAADRYNACVQNFGASYTSTTYDVNTYLARDFPIIEAYDGYLKVGRFGWYTPDGMGSPVSESTTNRVVVGPSDSPDHQRILRFAQCCFHKQAAFRVRTGGEWVTVGSASGLLTHVRSDPTSGNRCVLSCDPRLELLNSRAFDVPWAKTTPGMPQDCMHSSLVDQQGVSLVPQSALDRDSPLAMRNPMFSFVMWSGCGTLGAGPYGEHTLIARDDTWRFSLRGGFPQSITVPIGQGTTVPVSPQSMRFINSIGQLAVVDGAQQGLVLIDLNTLLFAHNPYF